MSTLFLVSVVIGGTVLGFQFLLMLLGGGDDGGGVHDGGDLGGMHHGDVAVDGDVSSTDPSWHETADADMGHPGAHWFYEVLSLRTISAALTFFGLAGKAALGYGYSDLGSFVLASVAGLGGMYGVYWLFKQAYKMQHSGSENVRNSIGAAATVYVPIPGKRAGVGKVTFRMQQRLVEYQAVTDEEERLKTGEKVFVVGIINSDTVRVGRGGSIMSADVAPVQVQEQSMMRSV